MESNHRLDLSIGFEELIEWIALTTMNTVSWAESVAAWSSFATAVFTLGLLVAAVWAGFTAVSAMRASKAASNAAAEANEQMKLDSIAQTRPYVYADIVPSLAGRRHFDLRITNVGKTAARNLHIQFDNWPEKIDDVAEHVKILLRLNELCLLAARFGLTGASRAIFQMERPKLGCLKKERSSCSMALMIQQRRSTRNNTRF